MLTGRPRGTISLGMPRHRWKDYVRMDFKEIGVYTWNWIDWVQDRDYWRALVNAALSLRAP